MEQNRIPYPFFMTKEYEEIERNQKLTEMKQESSMEEKSDREYFKQMYPLEVKRYLKVIVEVLDKLDGKNSFFYDEYPDKIRTERLAETILKMIPLEKNKDRESQKNTIKILLWEEIIRRRNALR